MCYQDQLFHVKWLAAGTAVTPHDSLAAVGADSREVLSRPAPPPQATLPYGEHPDHVADVRLPHGYAGEEANSAAGTPENPAPMVLFLHGGFWRHQYDRAHTGPLAAALATAGFVVVTPEYRRTGAAGGGWP